MAWTEEQREALPRLAAQAADVGYERCGIVDAAECYRREPALGPGACGGLTVPDESIIDPFSTPLAFATEAARNRATLRRDCPVTGIDTHGDRLEITTPNGVVRAAWLVNAAGLFADNIERMLGHDDLRVTPRRGQLIVFDKLARPLVRSIVLPVPTGRTKGVLVAPTVFGNVMLGPTAEDLEDKSDRASTADGLEALMRQCRTILPALADEEVTAVYAGLRAATDDADYRLAFRSEERTVRLAGIRSTGLTSSMALAEWVADHLSEAGVDVTERADAVGVQVPNLGEAFERPHQDAAMIARDPDYGHIICHCERVTAGEIRDALSSTVPAADLDGLRRRTRALMGRCQGFYCTAEVVKRVAAARGCSPEVVLAVPPASGAPHAKTWR